MPEGDSIYRVATQLRPHLQGVPLVAVTIGGVVRDELAGARATAVTPVGKHLLIDLDRGWQLRVHLGMNGRWRRFRAGGDTPPRSASLILATATDAFACLRAHTVELTARRDPRHGRAVASLGPDVLVVSGDHATPSILAGHGWQPVPALVASTYCGGDPVTRFTERDCIGGTLGLIPAHALMPVIMAHALRFTKYGA
jgi:formamidopyrimidine-DNA glycosylase